MTRTHVLLLAALVLAPLFSLLMRAVMRRLEAERSRSLEPGPPSLLTRVLSPAAPASVASLHDRDTPRSRVTAIAAETRAMPGRLGRHQEVRRGLVLMAILGPCRALDPSGD